MKYSIRINNEEVPVSEEIYRVYWKGVRKERYFAESDMHNHVFSYDALDTEDMNGEEIFADSGNVSIDDQIIRKLDTMRLYEAISTLSKDEHYIIYKMYFCRMTMRALAKELGLALSTLHYRHRSILNRLREYMLHGGQ